MHVGCEQINLIGDAINASGSNSFSFRGSVVRGVINTAIERYRSKYRYCGLSVTSTA
jgi:hypothetical protein